MSIETIQDWIQAFESHIGQRFNKKIFIIALEGNNILDTESICKIVSNVSGIQIAELKNNARKQEIVAARHVAMFMIQKYVKSSLKEIGKHFGNRNHTTVVHACKSVQDKLKINDAAITALYNTTKDIINKIQHEGQRQ